MMHRKTLLLIVSLLPVISCQENFDRRLEREAQEYTQKHCPYYVEEGNTMDSITYNAPQRTLTRWYTLKGPLDSPIARETTLKHLDKVKKQLLMELRGDTQWETCKVKQIKFRYSYRSANLGTELFHVTLHPQDYQN